MGFDSTFLTPKRMIFDDSNDPVTLHFYVQKLVIHRLQWINSSVFDGVFLQSHHLATILTWAHQNRFLVSCCVDIVRTESQLCVEDKPSITLKVLFNKLSWNKVNGCKAKRNIGLLTSVTYKTHL